MLEIEIIESNIIDGGIEVFARAWRDSVQIGFGKDGTVDIERFRVINPPVLVEDPLGDIVESNYISVIDKTVITLFKEDPEEAILQSLEDAILLVGKDGSNIVAGTVGNTTTTVYATTDARFRDEGNTTWSEGRDSTTAANFSGFDIDASTSAGPYQEIISSVYRFVRYFANFDTSAIGSDTISSAIFSVYISADPWNTGDTSATSYVSVIQNDSASDTTFVANDYDNIYNADDTIPLSGTKDMKELCDSGQRRQLSTTGTGYNDWTLNATGEGVIDGSGYTKIGLATGHDMYDSDPYVSVYTLSGIQYRGVGYTGAASDPKLVVEHSAASTQNSTFLQFMQT